MPTDETLLAELLEQEERLQLSRYDNDDAFRLGMMLVERARADRLALTVDLTRVHQQLFHVALPGTTLDNDHWVRRKTAVVYRFHRSSLYMGVSCRVKGVSLAERFARRPSRVRGPWRRVPDPGARRRSGRHRDRFGTAAGGGSPAGGHGARALPGRRAERPVAADQPGRWSGIARYRSRTCSVA